MSTSTREPGGNTQDFASYGAEAFKQFQSTAAMPNIDFESIINSHRKNMESMSIASQAAAETVKSIAQAQGRYARQAIEDMASYARKATPSSSNAQEQVDAQAQFIKDEVQKAMSYSKEVSDIWNKSQDKLTKIASGRLNEYIEETKQMAKGAAKKSS